MNKDGPHTVGLNLRTDLRDAIQRLRTKGARKVAKEDEQNGRFIHQIEQRAARLRMKLKQGVGEIRLLSGLE
jgi:hypothetical protein